jgi:hypothetical protein
VLISVAAGGGAGGASNGVLVVTGIGDGASENDAVIASSMIASIETEMIAAAQSLRWDSGGSHRALGNA